MYVIETSELTKIYGDLKAVDNVSIHVKEGEIYGFIGLNGAGKTTTIRMLLGLVKPDKGYCKIFNEQPTSASDIWNKIGYMIETPYSYDNLSVIENLEVLFKLRGLSDKKLINNIIDKLQLSKYKNKKAKHLSLGNKQRLGLAKALIHKPKLLLLDEPINGLDPAGIVEIRKLLKDLTENHNTTIFISSHILSEIAKITTRLGIINNGLIIKEINSNELDNLIIKKLQVNTNNNTKALNLLESHYSNIDINKNIIEISDPMAFENPEKIASLLVNNGIPPKILNVYAEDLEDYFLRTIKV